MNNYAHPVPAFLSSSRQPAFAKRKNRPAAARRKDGHFIEVLEARIAPAYTFALTGTTATVTGNTAIETLVIDATSGGLLEHSVAGGAFSTDWNSSVAGIQTLAASAAATVSITLDSGNGSSLTLGTPAGPASHLLAAFSVAVPTNTSDFVTIDDSAGSTQTTYAVDTQAGTITGGGIHYTEFGQAWGGGVTLKTSPINGNVVNVNAIYANEPFSLITGSAGLTNVNIGNGVLTLGSPISVRTNGGTGTAALNVNDHADATHGQATFDNLSGNANAPYEMTGLSTGAIEYGAGVTALTLTAGTNGANGVTFNINNLPSTATTTITGGANQNAFNLSNASESGGLDNLPGPVVIHGGGSGVDSVTLEDSSANFNDVYNITASTVSRIVFGGLTYDGIHTLTLNAENTLGTNGNNTIIIANTANFVTTNINGQGGADTINVMQTGAEGVLNLSTGTAGSTVNVLADDEPVNINDNGEDTLNIGSTGGAGSLASISGQITILNQPSFNSLHIHDENSTIGKTWTIDADNSVGLGTESVAVTGSALISFRPGDLSVLTINGGSGANIFNVNGSAASIPTTITGLGADTFNIASSGLGSGSTDNFISNGSSATFNISPVTTAVHAVNVTGGATAAYPGDHLNYSGPGTIAPSGPGSGAISQPGFETVNFTNLNSVETAALSVAEVAGGNVVTVSGDQDYTNEADHFALGTDATGTFLQVSYNGSVDFYGQLTVVSQINVNGLGGNNDLSIDSSNGLINVPNGIFYDGDGFDTLHLTQTGGTTQTSDIYSVGPNNGDAQSVITGPSGTQTVFAHSLSSVTDLAPAANLTVNGTPANNAIHTTKGAAGSGSVAIDDFAPIHFSNKAKLTVNGQGGNDVINGFGAAGSSSSNLYDDAQVYDLTTSTTAGKATPGLGPVAVATGDLTGDGFDDIVTVNAKSGNISVLINNGDGTFKAPIVFKSGGLDPTDLVLGNFDAHPGLDLAVTNSGSGDIAIFSGNGAGGFGAPTFIKTAADPSQIAMGFLNSDAHEDLVVTYPKLGAISVLLGNGTGGFTPTTPIKTPIKILGKDPIDVVIADLNGDGKEDIVTANAGSGNVSFLAGNGDGTFATAKLFATGPHPTSVAVADLNGDGKLDLAVSDGVKNIVSILYGNGNVAGASQFQPQLQVAVAGSRGTTSIVAADFNGDGQLDIGLGNSAGGTFTILLGAGGKSFSQPYQIPLGANPLYPANGIVVDDLNNDGIPDLIVATPNGNDVRVLLGG